MTAVFARLEHLKRTLQPRLDLYLAVLLALAALTVYVRTLAPGVLDGDSGEWQYMANILGIPHSTGYPLYVLLAKSVTLVPLGNPAWRVNLLSALCAALTVPLVYLLAKRVARTTVPAVLAATFFALMPTLWGSATFAEVYALNTLLIALTLWFAVRFLDTGDARMLYGMALCFGLALTNHRVSFFIAPALLLALWFKRRALDWRQLSRAALAALVPLMLYLYIPLRAAQLMSEQSPETWDLYPRAEAIVNGKITAYYNHSLGGFLNLVTALDNRNKLGFQDASGQDALLVRLENAWILLREQIDPFGIILAIFGIGVLWRRERALTLFLLVAGASIAAVSIAVRAESTRYYMSGAYLVMVLFLASALGWILDKLDERVRAHPTLLARGLYYAAVLFFAFFPLTALYFNYARMDQSGNVRYDTYARAVLDDNLAENAVLVAPWEVATPIRYFQYVEGLRPDVLTIHESPVRPQYAKLLDAAHRLERPFYYAQFMPEDKNSDAPRTIQAVAFPIRRKPEPQFPLSFKLNDAVRVIGYDWTRLDPQTMRLAVYYRVLQPTRMEYVSEVELSDPKGETRGDWNRHPVSEYYPTYFWRPGEFYRDVYDVHLDDDAPTGEYSAELLWYEYDAGTARRDEASAVSVVLPNLSVP